MKGAQAFHVALMILADSRVPTQPWSFFLSLHLVESMQAAADPLNAVGLPTPDCGNSEEASVLGPSTGGQGAEFRDNVARSERFQVHDYSGPSQIISLHYHVSGCHSGNPASQQEQAVWVSR